jgi:hypothetical protein
MVLSSDSAFVYYCVYIMRGFNFLTRMRSKRGGGAAGVLADEGCARRDAEERRARHLRERAGQRTALRLLRHTAWRLLLRQLRGIKCQFVLLQTLV